MPILFRRPSPLPFPQGSPASGRALPSGERLPAVQQLQAALPPKLHLLARLYIGNEAWRTTRIWNSEVVVETANSRLQIPKKLQTPSTNFEFWDLGFF